MGIVKTIGVIAFALVAALGCAAGEEVAPTATPASAPSPAATATATTVAASEMPSGAPSPAATTTAAAREMPASAPSPTAAARESTPSDDGDFRTLGDEDLEIVTLLGFDAIPAILEPEFVDAARADEWLDDDDLVIGVSINGDSRAYSVPMLSAHEIVNDVVGGAPIAVTW